MHFGQPVYLALFLLVAVMAGGCFWLLRWRQRARAAFAGPQARSWPAAPLWPRLLLLIAGASVLALAAARPQWGSIERQDEQEGIDLVIVLDVSQSMQATDAQPTRMAVAQDELSKLVESMRGNRFGLVTFAGGAFLRSPLTTDAQAMSAIIKRADKEAALVPPGSDLGAGLKEAARVLEASDHPGKAVLLVSDGEDFGNAFTEQAAALRQKNVLVYTAGAGTTTGAPLFDTDFRGQKRPKTDKNNQPVISRLNETSLNAIASAGGGRYIHLDGAGSLSSLHDDLLRLQQTPLGANAQRLPIERYQVFVAVALALLALSWLLPARMPFASTLGRLKGRLPRGLARSAATPLVLVLGALLFGACGGGGENLDVLRSANADANKLYNSEQYGDALAAYQKLLSNRPDIPELSYNVGNTLERLGAFERAVTETQRALPPADRELGAKTYYALGNHLLAADQLEQAYDAYKNALLLDPSDLDSKFNLEVTLKRLAQRPPQQQPGSGGPGDQAQSPGQQGPSQSGQEGQQQPQQNQAGQGQAQQPPQGQPGQSDSTGADAARSLQDALKGLDQNLSVEDAVKILDLLRQEQQKQQVPRNQLQSGTNGVDY